MTDRLIYASVLKKALSVLFEKKSFGYVVDIINAQPTVDAVEVVRCKDCKWFESAQLKRDGTDDKRYKPSVCVKGTFAKVRKADWYCADGERREDGKTD